MRTGTTTYEIKNDTRTEEPSPSPRDKNDVVAEYPLSYGQKALWFVQRMNSASSAHNVVHAARILTELDIELLRQTIEKIGERQQCLRTTFGTSQGRPVQRVHRQCSLSFTQHIISRFSPEQLRDFLSTEIYRPFDLECGPLIRVSLLTRAADDHIFLLAQHHIITDMWSIALFMHEVSHTYMSAKGSVLPPLQPLSVQYADFVQSDIERLAGEEGERLWKFWQEHLAGDLPVLEVPTDFPRPSVQTSRGGRESMRLPSDLTTELKSLSASHKTKLFTSVLAAFFALLHRYTGQTDLIIGTPKANRSRKTASIMGYFINPIVLRANVSGDPTFSEFLGRVQRMVSEAFEHDSFPFPLLVERLQPARDLSRSPIFQVLFSWQKTAQVVESRSMTSFALGEEGARTNINGMPFESVFLDQQAVPFDLSLLMAEAGGGELAATVEYNVALFRKSTIARMLEHFRTLLQGIVRAPDVPLSRMPLLTEDERTEILVNWNTAAPNELHAPLVHDAVTDQAMKTPDATAIVFRDESLTYRELDERATQLAGYLKRSGVRPESLVGVCLDRSTEAIVSLLGILKAGGAYVPLDPESPKERLSYILDDAQVRVVLSHTNLLDRFPTGESEVICLDRDWKEIAQHRPEIPLSAAPRESTAYVIYTSGSTGKPKGVLISHDALANHCYRMREHYGIRREDRVLQFASFSFDASLEQIFPTLMSGATVVLRDSDMFDPVHFVRRMSEVRPTVINLPPAFWHQVAQAWAREPERCDGKGLRLVIIGGDVMHYDSVTLWRRSPGGQARLLNAYGPTETTITALMHEIAPPGQNGSLRDKIPVGRPLPGRTAYILDTHLNPLPVGVPGELYIGAAGLGRGYLGQPDLTAEKFLPDPFGKAPGARLYRTGDLVRFGPTGTVEFIGRSDHQVKVRGFRIELGEIESLLSEHPDLMDAVVLAKETPEGDKKLVAYIVPAKDPPPSKDDLRRYLKEKLPGYMIPSVFVKLSSVPLTPGGKVNRLALPEPIDEQTGSQGSSDTTLTPIQQEIANIWEEILGVRQIGPYDNFFDLGGHSLLATQIVSRVRDAFQVDVSLQNLFETPTVAHLATLVEQGLVEQEGTDELSSMIQDLESLNDEEVHRSLREEHP